MNDIEKALNEAKREHLIQECKRVGIASYGKLDELRARLIDYAKGEESNGRTYTPFVENAIVQQPVQPQEQVKPQLVTDVQEVEAQASQLHITANTNERLGQDIAEEINERVFRGRGQCRYNPHTNCVEFRGLYGQSQDENIKQPKHRIIRAAQSYAAPKHTGRGAVGNWG